MTRFPISLFDSHIRRVGQRSARQNESHFHYLNRTARPMFEAVRELMDSWWRGLPSKDRVRTRAAFRSDIDSHMMAAFWELYLFRALRILGFRVIWHPKSHGRSTLPDFKALGQRNFYLEATMFGPSAEDVAAAKRRGDAFDRLDELGDSNFMVHIDIEREGQVPIQLRKLEARTRAWLEELDADEIYQRYRESGWESLPVLSVEKLGWRILLQAHPVPPANRGSSERSVGGYSHGGAVWVHDPAILKRLQSTIRKKATKYGRPKLPLVVAVLEDRDYPATSPMGMERALYLGADLPTGGRLSSLFGTPESPKLTRVSAVIVASRLVPWTVATYTPAVWHNPYATEPFDCPFPWPQACYLPDTGNVTWSESSMTAGEFLRLTEPWPPPDR